MALTKKGPAASTSSRTPLTPGAPAIIALKTRVNTKWSAEEIDSMVAQLKTVKDEGNTSENGFKASVQQSISNSLADPTKSSRTYETKWSRIKKDYKEVKFLRELSGFRQDDEKCVVTTEPEVQDKLRKVVPPNLFYIRY